MKSIRRWPILVALGLAVAAVIFFSDIIPWQGSRNSGAFSAARTPGYKKLLRPYYAKLRSAYWVLFKSPEICTRSEVWAGLGEMFQTNQLTEWAAEHAEAVEQPEGDVRAWRTPFGKMWFPATAEAWTVHFALAQYRDGAYPGLEVHKGDVVMDCGGYVGDYTKWALNAGASKAIVVEPATAQLECIRRNLAGELADGTVTVYAKGVWDKEERLMLQLDEKNPAANTVSAKQSNAQESIELTTIDRIAAEMKLDRLDVLKMDIEGAEVKAIHGARNTLNRFRPRLAMATEHTANVLENNRNVIKAVREVAPFYKVRCGYCALRSGVVTPYTLYFTP